MKASSSVKVSSQGTYVAVWSRRMLQFVFIDSNKRLSAMGKPLQFEYISDCEFYQDDICLVSKETLAVQLVSLRTLKVLMNFTIKQQVYKSALINHLSCHFLYKNQAILHIHASKSKLEINQIFLSNRKQKPLYAHTKLNSYFCHDFQFCKELGILGIILHEQAIELHQFEGKKNHLKLIPKVTIRFMHIRDIYCLRFDIVNKLVLFNQESNCLCAIPLQSQSNQSLNIFKVRVVSGLEYPLGFEVVNDNLYVFRSNDVHQFKIKKFEFHSESGSGCQTW